ncbi:hypothetical protein KDW65_19450 [Burkholderia cenocepacia]|uniref:hypothetical protein n=1 Tax=Burkholderia cepacia complex TaxID=87882 RepID=UPI0012F5243E|nr:MULTISPECIES: hypothetical protein [Burkholderia cepacia complex]MBR8398795.1 hypothetical protein [Burkholderia cenocepacia]MDN7533381.1 hypothetical protein [Burkholderia orbicola]
MKTDNRSDRFRDGSSRVTADPVADMLLRGSVSKGVRADRPRTHVASQRQNRRMQNMPDFIGLSAGIYANAARIHQ